MTRPDRPDDRPQHGRPEEWSPPPPSEAERGRHAGQAGVIGGQPRGNPQYPPVPPGQQVPPQPGYPAYPPQGGYHAAAPPVPPGGGAPLARPAPPAMPAPHPGYAIPAAPGMPLQAQARPAAHAAPGQPAPPGAYAVPAQPAMPMQPAVPMQPATSMPAPQPQALPQPPVAVPGQAVGLMNPVTRAAQRAAGTAVAAAATATVTGSAAAAATGAASAATNGSPNTPHSGTVYGGNRSEDGPILSGRLPRLRIGWHSASLGALAMLGVSSPGTGLILGADVDQKPVPIRFFRPEPTRVALVGGVWAAQMVAFRALSFGANAVVLTADPGSWQGFGERATGRSDRVAVIAGERPVRAQGSAQQPMLVIHDLGVVGPSTSIELGPWQTHMTVLRQLDERGVPALQEGQLVMMQRLAFGEATLAATALRLTGESAQLLQQMEDEMLAVIGGGADRYVWLSPTSIERRQAGPARR